MLAEPANMLVSAPEAGCDTHVPRRYTCTECTHLPRFIAFASRMVSPLTLPHFVDRAGPEQGGGRRRKRHYAAWRVARPLVRSSAASAPGLG
ncbi:protein of unknown function [Streptomyces murinus]